MTRLFQIFFILTTLAGTAHAAAPNAQAPLDAGDAAMAIAMPGLEALPLQNKVVVFNNALPVYDADIPGRIVQLTVQTHTAPSPAVNYYRSILMADGWQSQGVVSSSGMVMTKNGQTLQMRTRLNQARNSDGATILDFSIGETIPSR